MPEPPQSWGGFVMRDMNVAAPGVASGYQTCGILDRGVRPVKQNPKRQPAEPSPN